MSDVLILPDAEGAVRAWGKDLGLPHIGEKVFLGVPKTPPYPLVTVDRVGGLPDGHVDIDVARMTFSVWGGTREVAADVAVALVARINGVTCGTAMGGEAVALGAEVTLGPLWRPDREAKRPRYVVDAEFALRPTSG